jgi:glycosyltransferase involved in cell wall biosynthesis
MTRYVGTKNNTIYTVSDCVFTSELYDVYEVPETLGWMTGDELIANCVIRNGVVRRKEERLAAKDMKVALISNYGTKCGIGTYSKFLYDELVGLVGDYRVFNEIQAYENIGSTLPKEKIVSCWKRGESLLPLVEKVKEFDPDVILVQFEFGLFPDARKFLSMYNQLSNYRIITTVHSTYNHKDKLLVEAAMGEIVCHLDGAKKMLEDKGVSGRIHVIPHGCFPCTDKSRLWNYYKSSATFVQFGFAYKYKHYESSIRAAGLLKKRWKDVFFTGLFGESAYNKIEHQAYYEELMLLVKELGLEDNVGLIRGYQTEACVDAYLRTNRVAVFPYAYEKANECYGASGAAPYTMSCGIPVVSSNIHHFENLPTIKANSPEELATELDKLFMNPKSINWQVERQNKYLEKNSWKKTAERYVKVFEGR